MNRELPFEVNIPNADTTEALRLAESGADLTEYTTLNELKAATR